MRHVIILSIMTSVNILGLSHGVNGQQLSGGRPATNPTSAPSLDARLKEALLDKSARQEIGQLLAAGADPDLSIGDQGNTPTIVAASEDDIDLFIELLKYQADVNRPNAVGLTPLHVATLYGNVRMVFALCEAGASLNIKAPRFGDITPLHMAALQNQWGPAEMLIKHGADLNARDWQGMTPLHLAAKHRRPSVARLLVVSGADTTLKEATGLTALEVARAAGNDNVVAAIETPIIERPATQPRGN